MSGQVLEQVVHALQLQPAVQLVGPLVALHVHAGQDLREDPGSLRVCTPHLLEFFLRKSLHREVGDTDLYVQNTHRRVRHKDHP